MIPGLKDFFKLCLFIDFLSKIFFFCLFLSLNIFEIFSYDEQIYLLFSRVKVNMRPVVRDFSKVLARLDDHDVKYVLPYVHYDSFLLFN